MINILKNGITRNSNLIKNVIRTYSQRNARPKTEKFKKIAFYMLTAVLTTVACYKHVALPEVTHGLEKIKAIDIDDSSIRNKFNFIESVVKNCAPAVVYIEIQDPRRMDPETGEPMIISNGSGFILREDGWILTNAHVVINKPQAIITVKLHDGSIYTGKVEDADMNIDLALIKINSIRSLPALSFAKTDDVTVGEWVIALGSPLSLSHSVTAGIISSANRAADELGLRNHSMQYIQTDASITFGNSGGPLVNLDGDVIGINNLRITAGISFAIPIGYAKKFLHNGKHLSDKPGELDVDAYKKQLGIATMPMTEAITTELQEMHQPLSNEIGKGVLVWKVVSNSIAHMAGLQAGDIITHINNTPVEHTGDIYKYITLTEPFLKLEVIREGQKIELILKYI